MINPIETYGKIKIYNICDVLEAIYPGYFDMQQWPSYEESGKMVMEWAEANDCSCYSAPRESFCMYEGAEVAIKEGKSGVVVEDLS